MDEKKMGLLSRAIINFRKFNQVINVENANFYKKFEILKV